MTDLPPHVRDLKTPRLLLERGRLQANAEAMRALAQRAGVALRPHAKTVKCVEALELAHGGRRGPLTVSTLAEARFFAAAGFDDLFWAVAPAWSRLSEAAALGAAGVRLTCACDHRATGTRIAAAAQAAGVVLPVRVEVDCGYGRAGLPPGDPELLALAEQLHRQDGTELAGVFTHAGHSYGAANAAEVARIAAEEREAVVAAADTLRAVGLPCPAVSAGSTPTACLGVDWAGVTELRPGNYLLFDLTQAGIGSCEIADIAASVMATVIGHQPAHGHVTIDAGSLALSSDHGAAHRDPSVGYGLVCTLQGEVLQGLQVRALSQEHGWVAAASPGVEPGSRDLFAQLPIGAKVRILPSHSCTTSAAYDAFVVCEGARVEGRWRRVAGW